ncbi:MAG TPA: mRNA surveillance protein Pelota [Nitrososphaeraceae archaeon]|nr:mRNA surveillance protein Pelota [Nitrososphaeraceae archaeon]
MIVKEVKGSAGTAYFLIPQDPDDLFSIRRILSREDLVIATTTRVIRQEKEYSRPDRGERLSVKVWLRVDSLGFDKMVDRLRIKGIISNASSELVPRGSHHSLTLGIGDNITIEKKRDWLPYEKNIIHRFSDDSLYLLVAVDLQECAVAKLSGTHLGIVPNIYSGQSGKRYHIQTSKTGEPERFFDEIINILKSQLSAEDIEHTTDKVIIFGPGETKKRLYNFLVRKEKNLSNLASVIEGIDVAGEDGILLFVRSPRMKEVMENSKISTVLSLLDDIMIFVSRGENRFAMGFGDVAKAAAMRAVESVIFSSSIFGTVGEDELVKLLNTIESQGASAFAIDSSTDIGMRVSALGGIVSVLRYQIGT